MQQDIGGPDMDLNKSREFFDPNKVKVPCHIIGCGSIGSNVAELLARQGVEEFILWDMDIVETHNIVNQLYTEKHVGMKKTKALLDILSEINPAIKRKTIIKEEYTDEILEGYVFMCVDNVEVRKQIIEVNYSNLNIEAVFDFRTTLLEGQHYAAKWTDTKYKRSLLNSLDFTHEEAKTNTPVSACGFELSVAPVVKGTAILGIINFMNYINENELAHVVIFEPFSYAMLKM
jgi:hypothetical protein